MNNKYYVIRAILVLQHDSCAIRRLYINRFNAEKINKKIETDCH